MNELLHMMLSSLYLTIEFMVCLGRTFVGICLVVAVPIITFAPLITGEATVLWTLSVLAVAFFLLCVIGKIKDYFVITIKGGG